MIFITRGNKPSWQTRLIAAAVWLVLWHLAAERLALPLLLPGPGAVFRRLAQLAAQGFFWETVCRSISHILGGFVLGLAAGGALAAAAFVCRFVQAMVQLPLALIKAAPVTSFIILALVWLPARRLSLFIAFLMTVPLAYENSFQGLAAADPLLLEMAQVFRLPRWQVFRQIYLPALAPYGLSALRTGLGFAWKAGAAAEALAVSAGTIGGQLYNAKVALETVDLFAWTTAIILLSLAMEKAISALLGRSAGGKAS